VLGVEVRVTDNLGIFAEGGAQYRRLRQTAVGPTGLTVSGSTTGDVDNIGGIGITAYF
jgi:hypothetical protein